MLRLLLSPATTTTTTLLWEQLIEIGGGSVRVGVVHERLLGWHTCEGLWWRRLWL